MISSALTDSWMEMRIDGFSVLRINLRLWSLLPPWFSKLKAIQPSRTSWRLKLDVWVHTRLNAALTRGPAGGIYIQNVLMVTNCQDPWSSASCSTCSWRCSSVGMENTSCIFSRLGWWCQDFCLKPADVEGKWMGINPGADGHEAEQNGLSKATCGGVLPGFKHVHAGLPGSIQRQQHGDQGWNISLKCASSLH